MAFKDNYKDEGGGGSFIGKAEKEELIASKTVLNVSAVGERTGDKYGDQYVVSFELDNEPRVASFKKESVFSRDRMLRAMKEYLEGDECAEGETVGVIITREGQAQVLVLADEE